MGCKSLLLVVVAGLLLAGDAKDDDLKKLEGSWTMVSGEEDGTPLAADVVKAARLTIAGDQHDVTVGANTFKGTHKLDPGQKPKAIDASDTEGPFKGKTKPGIYETDGDTFKICFSIKGDDRPKAFDSKAGSGNLVHIWKKKK